MITMARLMQLPRDYKDEDLSSAHGQFRCVCHGIPWSPIIVNEIPADLRCGYLVEGDVK